MPVSGARDESEVIGVSGVVKIHGREYKTVSLRVSEFREKYKDWAIETDIIENGNVVVVKAVIKNPEGVIKATGYAEEVRGSTNINKTSALENCETSAIGRALANIGLAGQEYASANEVSNAIIQQAKQEVGEYFVNYNAKVRELFSSISEIKKGIDEGNLDIASEAYFELTDEEKIILNLAPSKGGIFTTKERETIKSKEFREAYYTETKDIS